MPKKTTAKKTISKKNGGKRRTLKRIPKEQYFVLLDGTRVGHYLSLADILEKVEKTVLNHHVNEVRNDFASWISEVFEEKELAKLVKNSTSPEEIRLHIYKHVIKEHIRR
ncbi:MAG: hypothetical protein KDK61_09085 [Simkania sp.]|nr:hypothetical protein [Simkania sp.]